MRKSAVLFMLLAPYAFVFCGPYSDVSSIGFMIGLSVLGLICGLNMVNALMTPRRGADAKVFLFWNLVLKVSFVPLYGLCFILMARYDDLVQSVMIFVLLAGLMIMLTTASYGWRGLWIAEQTGMIHRDVAIFHAVLQVIYVVDVVSALYCYWRICHCDKNEESAEED